MDGQRMDGWTEDGWMGRQWMDIWIDGQKIDG